VRARQQVNKSQRKSSSSQCAVAVSIRLRLDEEGQAPARGEKNIRELRKYVAEHSICDIISGLPARQAASILSYCISMPHTSYHTYLYY